MKHLLITTIAAVLLVGCGPSVDIWEAAEQGNIATVKQHLAAGTDANAKEVDGETSLHYADTKEIAVLLIGEGVDVNAKTDGGGTPLHSAAMNGYKEIAELLIAKGADVNAKVVSGPKQGLTPLDAANATNHPKTADLLRKHGAKTAKELKAEGK